MKARFALAAIAAFVFVFPVFGQCISLTTPGASYTQDFNTLPTTGSSSTLPPGWAFVETGTNANTTFTAGTGSSNAGDTYNFGSTGSTDRALGGLLSGSLTPTIGACFKNDTGAPITSVAIAYTGEQWRMGQANRGADRLDFQISTNATALLTGTFADFDALDFNSPITTGTAGALDGNAAANRSNISSTISALSIAPGATFWIRWNDFNVTGSDDGLALDDFSLTPTSGAALPAATVTFPANNSTLNTHSIRPTGTAATSGVPVADGTLINAQITGPGSFSGNCSAITNFGQWICSSPIVVNADATYQASARVDVNPFGSAISFITNTKPTLTSPAGGTSATTSVTFGGTKIGDGTQVRVCRGSQSTSQCTGAPLCTATTPAAAGSWTCPATLSPGTDVYVAYELDAAGGYSAASAGLTLSVGTTSPTATGSATPSSVLLGASTTLSVTVTPGANPTSTGISVTADLSSINGSATQAFTGSGNVFTYVATIPANATTGAKSFPVTIADDQSRTASTSIALTVNKPVPAPGTLVISQFYGGGHNTGSTYNNDFVEIFNRSSNPVPLDGFALQTYLFPTDTWTVTPLSGTIAPHSYYLVQEASGPGGGTVPLPSPDLIGTADVASTAGNIAITASTTQLTPRCSTSSDILDFIGYSSSTNNATCGNRTTIPTSLSNTIAASRTLGGCSFTGNVTDWSIAPPAPRNGATAPNDCSTAVANTTPHVVISQVYGGGGNSGSTYTNDFLELYNPTGSDVDLSNWSIQYASTTGSGWSSNIQPLGGTIPAGSYFLIQLGTGTAGDGIAVPDPRIIGSINMAAGAGKIALVKRFSPVSGNCPIGDLDLVDFVGYGTGTDCFEGGSPAPGISNSQAAVRNNNADTDQNRTDFNATAPQPHGGGGFVSLPPQVNSFDPATTNAPADATITLNFNEPVTVDGNWWSINCSVSGAHTDATFGSAFGNRTYLITPNVNFTPAESCTVTVTASGVTNPDPTAPPDTLHPLHDFTFTFTVATGQPAPFGPEIHLAMGNPSNAIDDVSTPNNYLMMKPAYAESYNRTKGTPNWVSWHLDSAWYGSLARLDTFRADPAVPSDWYRVEGTDFSSTGFDRGHMCPNADRDNQNRIPINQATYLMSNMVPQAPDNNQGPWAALEGDLRLITDAGNEVFIVSGPAGVGGTGSNGGTSMTIANGNVTVPAFTWKVALVLPHGALTPHDATAAARTIAVIMPNTQGIRGNDWHIYLKTVRDVEALTGYDLFSNVSKIVQNSIERGTNGANPPGVDDETITTAEDSATTVSINAVSAATPSSFTYVIDAQPAHGTLSGAGPDYTYTPTLNFNGVDTFKFHVTDASGASNVATATINVTPVNDPPVATDDTTSTNEDVAVSVAVLGNDTDADNDTLTITSVGTPSIGTATISGSQILYTPNPNANGSDSFTYTISDGNGGTATATVHVTVAPVNDPPTANDDIANTNEDTPVTIDPIANDSDIDGDAMTLSSVSTPSNGTATIAGTHVVYAPNANFNGTDTFTYTITDGNGGTATAKVTVTVNPVNDPPIAIDDTVSTNEDTPVTVSVLNNDTDIDSISLTIVAVGTPSIGTATINGSQILYTPNANANGSDSFTYTISDGNGGMATATVHVTVISVDDAPVVAPVANRSIEIGATASAQISATDIDSATLTYAVSPANVGASISATGLFTWTPSAAYANQPATTFTVTVSDGTTSVPVSFTVTVTDSTAPFLSVLTLSTTQLWPPNHQMVDVTVNYTASDIGDASPACTLHVTSNEPVNGTGDGDTAPDWNITDAHHLQLRAERAGGGSGRVYTITADCADRFGNLSHSAPVTVSVAKSQGNSK